MMKVNTELLWETADSLRQRYVQLNEIIDQVSGVRQGLRRCGSSFWEFDSPVLKQLNALRSMAEQLRTMYQAAEDAASLYARCEEDLCRVNDRFTAASPFLLPDLRGKSELISTREFGDAFDEIISPLLNDYE